MGRDPAGPGSRGGNRHLDTVEDVRDYVADHPEVFGGIRASGELVVASFTADLERHLRGLQASVEHPELVSVELAEYPIAKLERDIRNILQRLRADPRRPFNGCSPGHIQLRAPFAELAADLHREYGDSLKITVGHKPYPPELIGDRQPLLLPMPTVTVAGLELTITIDEPHVAGGEDLPGRVIFANRGPNRVEGMTGVLTGGIRSDGHDYMAGNFAGTTTMMGYQIDLEPGSSTEMPLIIGTASRLPDTSYVVPPGRYEVVTAVPFQQSDIPPTPRPQLVALGAWLTVDAG
jgi:hypothetical protein